MNRMPSCPYHPPRLPWVPPYQSSQNTMTSALSGNSHLSAVPWTVMLADQPLP